MNNGPAARGDSEQVHGGTPSSSGPAVDTPQSLPWPSQRRILARPPDPGNISLVPTLRAQGQDSHASLPPNGQRSMAGACEEPITAGTSPTSTPITTRKKQLAAFHGHRCCCRSLMPDFAANQPMILARLPLQDGLDWLISRYGSAKNTLDTHHGTTASCSWRVALPCQCLAGPTCHAHHN